jgi:hypothetical protein
MLLKLLDTCGFTSPILHNSKIHYLWCSSSQKNELLWVTLHWSIPPFSNWSIWMFTQISQCFFIMIVPMSFGASFSFSFCYFSIVKNFNHVAKDASILHFKSCDCDNLTTSQLPPFQDTPPITTTNLLQAVDYWNGKILTFSLSYLTSFLLSRFFNTFVIFLNRQCVYKLKNYKVLTKTKRFS